MSRQNEEEAQHSPNAHRPVIPRGPCFCEYLNEPDKNWPEPNREQQLIVRSLHNTAKWTWEQISDELGHSRTAVERVCASPPSQSQSRRGLSDAIKNKIRGLVAANDRRGKIPWDDLRFFIEDLWDCSSALIEQTFADLRSSHDELYWPPVRLYPGLDEGMECMKFAQSCLERWTPGSNWIKRGKPYMLFTGSAWAHTNPIQPAWKVTHNSLESYQWDLLQAGGHGWMIWGCFAGKTAGPCFIWPKTHESITADGYIKHIVPLITKFLADHPGGVVTMDHTTPQTDPIVKACFSDLGVEVFRFPETISDDNPMLDIFRSMEGYMCRNYDTRGKTLEEVREILYECWDAVNDIDVHNSVVSARRRLTRFIRNTSV